MESKKEKYLHVLPGAQKAMQQNVVLGMPVMKPSLPTVKPLPRPFGMIHDYLNPKPPPAPKLQEDEKY
jgi:hypothetical protein